MNMNHKNKRRTAILVIAIIAVLSVAIYPTIDVKYGISAAIYEKDARTVLEIPSDWEMIKAYNKDCVAFLFYKEDKSESKFTVYETSVGNFLFGTTSCMRSFAGLDEDDVYEHWGNNDTVYFSMNNSQFHKVIFAGDNVERIENVNPNQPFVMLVPNEYKPVQAYVDNFCIDFDERWFGEILVTLVDFNGDGQNEIVVHKGFLRSTNPIGIGELEVYEKINDVYQPMQLPFCSDAIVPHQYIVVSYSKADGQAIRVSVDGTDFERVIEIPDEHWTEHQYSSIYTKSGVKNTHSIGKYQVLEQNGVNKLVCRMQLFDKWSTWGLDFVLSYQENQMVIDDILFFEDILKTWE